MTLVIKRVEKPMVDRVACPNASQRRLACAALCAAIAAGLLTTPAPAALYKWTDANGRVIYSDQPPNANVKVETLNAPPPPANPNAAKDLAAKDAELKKAKQARADEEAKEAKDRKARVDANMLRQDCQRARAQALALTQSSQVVIYSVNEKGERVSMSDAARLAERERLDVWINENCKGV